MNRLIMAAVVGLMMASALSTSASALTCVARSPNGARGAPKGYYSSLEGLGRLRCAGVS